MIFVNQARRSDEIVEIVIVHQGDRESSFEIQRDCRVKRARSPPKAPEHPALVLRREQSGRRRGRRAAAAEGCGARDGKHGADAAPLPERDPVRRVPLARLPRARAERKALKGGRRHYEDERIQNSGVGMQRRA